MASTSLLEPRQELLAPKRMLRCGWHLSDQLQQGLRCRVGPFVTVCRYALVALASYLGVWAPGLKVAVCEFRQAASASGPGALRPRFIRQSSLVECTAAVFRSGAMLLSAHELIAWPGKKEGAQDCFEEVRTQPENKVEAAR